MRRTLVIIKPDAVMRGNAGQLISRFERKGLKIVGMKMEQLNEVKLNTHYQHLKDKPFFPELVKFMSAIPCILMVLEGKEAVSVVRRLVGTTLGREADVGSVRGDYSMSNQANLIHASENDEAAEKEIKLFFKQEELWNYELITFEWIYSSSERGK
ncbi:MAG: nucleoside-diphosphate kinase [Candidatus Diapherotrites archaeon]|nr:nucleoside-diphosphate kinase [Candidatus Diapherotrites archaeon]